MLSETAIDRVRSFIRWSKDASAMLSDDEYWIPPAAWRTIFDKDDANASMAATSLHSAGLLRGNEGSYPPYQCLVHTNGMQRIAYCISCAILEWAPSTVAAQDPFPPPPLFPDNFADLDPNQQQNLLLKCAMYLEARLMNCGLALDPQDSKEITQLSAFAQGIIQTSVKLEQIRVEKAASNDGVIRNLITEARQNVPAL